MFKLRLPMAIMVSSGGLMLLISLGGLVLIASATTSQTSETNPFQINQEDNQSASMAQPPSASEHENRTITSRGRSARFFNNQDASTRSQSAAQQHERSMESYAAALAAANSATDPSNGSADLVQSTMAANDAASFGEQAISPQASTGRQFEATEYSPVHAAGVGSYYATGSASSASNYLPNHLGHQQQSSGAGYHHLHHPQSSPSSATYSNHQQQHLYSSQPATSYSHQPHYPAASKKVVASLPPLGYPANSYDYWSSSPGGSSYFGDRSGGGYHAMPYWAHSSTGGFGSSLMSSATSALSHWTGGFGVTEIICGIIALSIGAVILGAPFFLIYLALMGNFSGSSTLSLTNPTQGGTTTGGLGGSGTTTVNGRRKRLAIFETVGDLDQPHVQMSALADTIIGQLSPFVDFQQVTATFKRLVESIEKYSKLNEHHQQRPKQQQSATNAAKSNSRNRK